jgi:hypothetical protein
MPYTGPLDALRTRLREQTAPHQIFPATEWGSPRGMTEVLKRIRRDFGNEVGESINVDRVKVALAQFVQTQDIQNFTQLKYLCFGVLLPVPGNQWCLLDREALFDRLLAIVINRQSLVKQFRKCFQGLMAAYFAFDLYAEKERARSQNWRTLRTFLAVHHPRVVAAAEERGVLPDWLRALSEHKNLLSETPCQRYSADLIKGDTEQLKAACSGLGITATSWVWTDALMAYVDKVCNLSDREFNTGMLGVLKLINGRSELKLPEHLEVKATAKIVIRYSACADKSEQNELRDTCVTRVGNPWLNRTAWDARVNHEPARVMVEGWVKKRLIRDFFELLAHDGRADVRRLNFWLKWEPQITDMWFVLGADARRNQSAAFDDVRKRMGNSARRLTDSDDQNNAFVMRIGPLLAIEFGMTGNACYIFAASEFNSDLNQQWLDSKRDLKQSNRRKWLAHQGQWEPKFDSVLRELLRTVPAAKGDLKFAKVTPTDSAAPRLGVPNPQSQAPMRSPFAAPLKRDTLSSSAMSGGPLLESDFEFIVAQCKRFGIDWQDNRAKAGAFWVMVPDRSSSKVFTDTLEQLGFNFAPSSKGFWYKRK